MWRKLKAVAPGDDLRLRLTRLKASLRTLKARLLASRAVQNPVAILAWRVVRELGEDDASHLAAGVAYYALFSLFPLLLGLLAIAGTVLAPQGIQSRFLDFVAGYLPPGAADLVRTNVQNVVRFRAALGSVSIIGLLWSGSAAFGAITRALNRAWNIRQDRPFYVAKPRQLGMALGIGVLFFVSVALTSIFRVLLNLRIDILGVEVRLPSVLNNLALQAVPWLITFSIFLLLYKFVPNCKTRWRYIWLGALVATILFEVGKNLFIWYLGTFASYAQVYGQLASVMVLLLWAYISAFILILGAEISSEYERLRSPRAST